MTPSFPVALALAALAASSQEPFANQLVTVTEQFERPPAVSGVFAAFVLVYARAENGETAHFYFPYLNAGQDFPRAGQECRFWYKPGRIELVGGFQTPPDLNGSVVTAYDCGPGRNPVVP